MVFSSGARTDKGLVREENEDSLYSTTTLIAVADGMGGHRAGEVASGMAIDAVRSLEDVTPSERAFRTVFSEINSDVYRKGMENPELRGMGTTLTVASVEGSSVTVAHVGDSRAYLISKGEVRQLTEDHSLVQQLVSSGRITREEASSHISRNLITNAIGMDEDLDRVDLIRVEIGEGDFILLCTDGLSGPLTDSQILAAVTAADVDPQWIADHLTEEAIRRGGPDNITVVVAKLSADDGS